MIRFAATKKPDPSPPILTRFATSFGSAFRGRASAGATGGVRTGQEIAVPLSPFALRKFRGFRGAKDDTKTQNGPKQPNETVSRGTPGWWCQSTVELEISINNALRCGNVFPFEFKDTPADIVNDLTRGRSKFSSLFPMGYGSGNFSVLRFTNCQVIHGTGMSRTSGQDFFEMAAC